MPLSRLLLVALALMASQAALHIVRPMTSYRLLAFGEGGTSVGIVTAAFALAPLVIALPVSRWATGTRTARLGLFGSVVMLAGCVGLAYMTSTGQAVASSVVLGAGQIAVMLSLQTLVTQESVDDRYDRDFGLFSAGASLGQLIGPIVGTAILSLSANERSGTTNAMIIAAAVCALAAVVSAVLTAGAKLRKASISVYESVPGRARDMLGHRGSLSAIYVGLIVLSGIDLLTAYLPVLGEQTGMAPMVVGALLSVRAGVSIATRLVLGKLVALSSRSMVLIVTTAMSSVMFLVLPKGAETTAVIVVIMVVLGFGLGVGQPLTMSWLALLLPEHLRSQALAVRLMGNRLGQVLAPSAAALVAGAMGTAGVFWLVSGLLATATLTVTRYHRKQQK